MMVVTLFSIPLATSLSSIKEKIDGKEKRPLPEQMTDAIGKVLGQIVASFIGLGVGYLWHLAM